MRTQPPHHALVSPTAPLFEARDPTERPIKTVAAIHRAQLPGHHQPAATSQKQTSSLLHIVTFTLKTSNDRTWDNTPSSCVRSWGLLTTTTL
eukprot:scaffold32770_cov42-Cyclotella_meneghiniana.AAC.1